MLLMANHVKAANAIYKNTGFADTVKPEGNEFVVRQLSRERLSALPLFQYELVLPTVPTEVVRSVTILGKYYIVLSAIVKHSVPCRGGGVSKEICGTVRLPV